jgi:hypothetical protein
MCPISFGMAQKTSIDVTYLIGILWLRERSWEGWGFLILEISTYASWIQRYYQADGKLWKDIIDHMYASNLPSIFYGNDRGSSPFWKRVMGAAKAAKMGFRWQVGNGKKIRFWEDCWFGSCSLAIQF